MLHRVISSVEIPLAYDVTPLTVIASAGTARGPRTPFSPERERTIVTPPEENPETSPASRHRGKAGRDNYTVIHRSVRLRKITYYDPHALTTPTPPGEPGKSLHGGKRDDERER